MPEEKRPAQGNRPDLWGKRWALPFFTIWIGQAFSLVGSRIVQFALMWWLTVETGSATVLATASLVGLLPSIILGPFAGTLVDRWDRQWIMLVADALIAIATIWLAYLFQAGLVQIWTVYLLMFVRSLGQGFHQPAMISSTSLMVPEKHLARVQGFNQTLNGGLDIVSAPLGALLIEILSMGNVLAIDVITAFFAIGPLLFIPIPQPEKSSEEELFSVLDDLKAGFKYVWGWQGLTALIVISILINLLATPSFSLLPLLVKSYFGGSAIELGWVDSAYGLGVILGGLLLGVWGGFKRKIVTSILGLLGFGAGLFVVGIAPSTLFYMAVAGMFAVGFMLPIINGPALAICQAAIDPKMQGRVFSLIGSLSSAMSPIGLAVAGPLANYTSVNTWFMAAGVVTLVLGMVSFTIRPLMNIEDSHDQQKPEKAPSPTK